MFSSRYGLVILCLLVAPLAACGGAGSAAGADTGRIAGTPCDLQLDSERCVGVARMRCNPTAATWMVLSICSAGELCGVMADPTSPAGQQHTVAVCVRAPTATNDAIATNPVGDRDAGVVGGPDTVSPRRGGADATPTRGVDTSTAGGPDTTNLSDVNGGGTTDAGAQPDTATAQPDTATAQPDTATAQPDTGTAQPDTGGEICGDGVCAAGESVASCAKDCATTTAGTGNYCDKHCGSAKQPAGCYCDDQCAKYGDCCLADGAMPTSANTSCANSTCGMCSGGGGGGGGSGGGGGGGGGGGSAAKHFCDSNCGGQSSAGCHCDSLCAKYGDCCLADGTKSTTAIHTCGGSTCGQCNGSTPTGPVCGNGTCEKGETSGTCATDCPKNACGDGVCGAGEDQSSCPKDCTATKTCTTFTQVGPILQNRCGKCHGFASTCSWAKGSAGGIVNRVLSGNMPPYGQPGVTSAQKLQLKAWLSAGAPCTTASCP